MRLCPVCNQQQPKVPRMAGAIKPITYLSFRDCFQVDLIDMRCRRIEYLWNCDEVDNEFERSLY